MGGAEFELLSNYMNSRAVASCRRMRGQSDCEAVPNSQGQNMDIESSSSSDHFCLELGNV